MKIAILCLVVFLSGCGCPVSVGDSVIEKSTGLTGEVVGKGAGGCTKNCTIAVLHSDGTYSKSKNRYGDSIMDSSQEYVYNWKYSKASDN